MKRRNRFWKHDCILFLIISFIVRSSTSDKIYLAEMLINECVKENWYIFSDEALKSPKHPFVIISMCHALPAYESITNYKDLVKVKPIARYSSHAFLLKFANIKTDKQVKIWQRIYERLMITHIQETNFFKKFETYQNDYPHYTASEFKDEFLRSRWNIDEISLYNSHAAYGRLRFLDLEGHLPYSIERTMYRHKNIADLVKHTLFYRIISGRGHRCIHSSLFEKLKSLTLDFNAYDRIFCDAFERYNLSFEAYWNNEDMFYLRGRLIRDDILSSFPADASKALYYASPMITYAVLQRDPLTWGFIFRPFPNSLWGLVIITFLILKGSQHLGKYLLNNTWDEITLRIFEIQKRYRHTIEFITGLYRTIIISAYSGMILLGILYPLFTWIPDTFKDLNGTTNYKICTSQWAPIKYSHMVENFQLNGVPLEKWEIRTKWFPAHCFAPESTLRKSIYTNFTVASTSTNSSNKSGRDDQIFFNAALMYDDKMNLWLKGRDFLIFTSSIFDKIKPAHDRVLSEIRYASLPAGATRLHFILDDMKHAFTSGVWIRYYNLEMNYYKYVAPAIVQKMKREEEDDLKDAKWLSNHNQEDRRALTLDDLYACFIGNGIGLVVACWIGIFEFFNFRKINT